MMKTKILKLLISTAWLLPLAPAAVLAKTDPEKADPAEHTEMSAAASEEDSDYGEDSDPAIMPSAPVCHGLAGVAWAVDENRILYLQAGRLEKTNFHQLFDVPSIREIRVVPTEDCSMLILPENCWALFWGFKNLTKIDSVHFNTSYVTDMNNMFSLCWNLKNLDLSSFDTSGVEDMSHMFTMCTDLESLDLSGFDTGMVKNMTGMFDGCSSLKSLDLSGFDTGMVKNMVRMFEGCSSLESLDLSSFDTGMVKNMDRMFDGCSSLESLDLSGFDISMVKKANLMFHGCSSLRCVILNKMTLADPSIAVIGGDDIQEENEQKQTFKLHNWIQ